MEVLPAITEIYAATARKFGVPEKSILGPARGVHDRLNTPRNIAALLCLVANHSRAAIAAYAGRSESGIKNLIERHRQNVHRLQLAWGIWWDLGGTWDDFDRVVRPDCQVLPLPLPSNEFYAIRGLSYTDDDGQIRIITEIYDEDLNLTNEVLQWLELDRNWTGPNAGEQALNAQMIKDALRDYITCLDAVRWFETAGPSDERSISLDDAVRILGIDPSWFRSRIERIAKYVRSSRSNNEQSRT